MSDAVRTLAAGAPVWQIATGLVLLTALLVIVAAGVILAAALLQGRLEAWRGRRARRRVARLEAEMAAERRRLQRVVIPPDLRRP